MCCVDRLNPPAPEAPRDFASAVARLSATFHGRRPEEASAAAQALAATLGDLLSSLIGPGLAGQVMRPHEEGRVAEPGCAVGP